MAYGDSLSSVATDTFDSSISGDWANGDGSWGTFTVTSGSAHPSAGATASNIRRTAETYADDQYSEGEATQNTQGIAGVTVRGQAGTDESAYVGGSRTFSGGQWWVAEYDSSFGFTALATNATGWTNLTAGDKIRIEIEGTTIRFGEDTSGTDTERVNTTDATLTSGDPGLYGLGSSGTNNQFTAWEGGDISAAAAAPFLPYFGQKTNTLLRM